MNQTKKKMQQILWAYKGIIKIKKEDQGIWNQYSE